VIIETQTIDLFFLWLPTTKDAEHRAMFVSHHDFALLLAPPFRRASTEID